MLELCKWLLRNLQIFSRSLSCPVMLRTWSLSGTMVLLLAILVLTQVNVLTICIVLPIRLAIRRLKFRSCVSFTVWSALALGLSVRMPLPLTRNVVRASSKWLLNSLSPTLTLHLMFLLGLKDPLLVLRLPPGPNDADVPVNKLIRGASRQSRLVCRASVLRCRCARPLCARLLTPRLKRLKCVLSTLCSPLAKMTRLRKPRVRSLMRLKKLALECVLPGPGRLQIGRQTLTVQVSLVAAAICLPPWQPLHLSLTSNLRR